MTDEEKRKKGREYMRRRFKERDIYHPELLKTPYKPLQ